MINPNGLHARPSHAIVAMVSGFETQVFLEVGDREADARSILSVMALGAPVGTEIIIRAEGADSVAAVDLLQKFFEDGFEEG